MKKKQKFNITYHHVFQNLLPRGNAYNASFDEFPIPGVKNNERFIELLFRVAFRISPSPNFIRKGSSVNTMRIDVEFVI